ncbi:hypothetical protein HYW94_03720 [Candidatus Uhrbacteria bacterium]|nr:hypothetical protein [Candidatus Uhrbacteria bacterium]
MNLFRMLEQMDTITRISEIYVSSDPYTTEERGQRELTGNDTLPLKMYGDAHKVLENFGVEFLEHVPGDSLFQFVKLPLGWKKIRTDLMWSDLVDEKGKKIAVIFYNATPWERRADLQLR